MHTDWHRYNLKRRITSLPPLASEVFAEKVLHIQATNRIERERATFSKECKTCAKTYFSENAYSNHLGSQKHRQNIAAEKLGIKPRKQEHTADKDETGSVISSSFSLGTAEGEESEARTHPAVGVMEEVKEEKEEDIKEEKKVDKEFVKMVNEMKIAEETTIKATETKPKEDGKAGEEEEDPEPLPLEECLFCNYTSPTLALNVSHMSKAHGLFIPEQSYLVDLPGLIRYLGEKVAILHECLYCGKMKGGLEGVRTHMRDVGHCRIAFESIEQQVEIGDFYDFRSTYEGVEGSDDEEEGGEPKLRRRSTGGIRNNKKIETEFKPEDGEGDVDEAGWETDSSASSLDSTELCAVPLDHAHSGGSSQDGRDHHHHHHHHHPHHHRPRHPHSHGHGHGHGHAHHAHAHHAHGPGHHHHPHSHTHHPHQSAVYHTEYELHLPDGRTAGHRSHNRYFRQNLSHPLSEQLARRPPRRLLQDLADNGDDEDVEEVEDFAEGEAEGGVSRELTRRERRDLFFGRMTEEDRAVVLGAEGARRAERGLTGTAKGELGMVGVTAEKRRLVREEERRARRDERRERGRMGWKVDKAGNSQKHYRDPLLQ